MRQRCNQDKQFFRINYSKWYYFSMWLFTEFNKEWETIWRFIWYSKSNKKWTWTYKI